MGRLLQGLGARSPRRPARINFEDDEVFHQVHKLYHFFSIRCWFRSSYFHEWSEGRFGHTARATFDFHIGCPGQLYRLLSCTWYFRKIEDHTHYMPVLIARVRELECYSYQKVRRRVGLCLLSLPFNTPLPCIKNLFHESLVFCCEYVHFPCKKNSCTCFVNHIIIIQSRVNQGGGEYRTVYVPVQT